MTKISVDREVLQAAVESIGARYSNLTLEEWDEVAEGIFQHLLAQPEEENLYDLAVRADNWGQP